MIKLEYNGEYYNLIDTYSINKSSREVTYNSLTIDFTNKTIANIPNKYQECHLVDVSIINEQIKENKIIFTGYVNTIVLPNMKNKVEYRELEIELLSPMALATRRTITAIGNYELKDLIQLILQPLYDDGFVLKEFNVGNSTLTVNYLIETVESSLNKLSNKYNFWWYIDENKNIYINSIDYQFAQKPKLTYNEDNQLKGLIDLIPNIDATDYCNVVNFNNVRTWQYSYYGDFIYNYYDDSGQIIYTKTYTLEKDKLFDDTTIKNEDEIIFNHSVDVKVENIIKSNISNFDHRAFTDYQNYALLMNYKYNDNSTGQVYIKVNNGVLQISNNATLENTPQTTKEFEFKRDTFFNNLITGFKYNNENKSITSIELIFSCSALMWTKLKINNLSEIQNSKGKVSTSGQIEKIINMNEQWKTLNELQAIGNAYIKTNSSQSDKINLTIDNDYNLNIGDIIKIERPSFLIVGTYIITDIKMEYLNNRYTEYKITLRNSNYFESYVDLFRATETEELEEKNYNLSTIDYEEGNIREVHEVV